MIWGRRGREDLCNPICVSVRPEHGWIFPEYEKYVRAGTSRTGTSVHCRVEHSLEFMGHLATEKNSQLSTVKQRQKTLRAHFDHKKNKE